MQGVILVVSTYGSDTYNITQTAKIFFYFKKNDSKYHSPPNLIDMSTLTFLKKLSSRIKNRKYKNNVLLPDNNNRVFES